MELKNIIEERKKIIIFEDTDFKTRQEIDKAKINLGLYLDLLSEYSGDIIVISRNDNRMEIFEEAINKNITIDFVSTGVLRSNNFDISIFENKAVLFIKSFDGMTSETNNTFININNISNICKKLVAVDSIGENFLYVNYFPALLKLLEIHINIDFYNVDKKTLDQLLFNNFVIVKEEKIMTSISRNYWFGLGQQTQSSYTFGFEGFDVSNKIQSIKNKYDNKSTNHNNEKFNYEDTNGVYLNKTLYVILAIFFGGLGAHKIYERKFGLGVLYFIFIWTYIPIFFSIYEGIKAIGKPQTEDGKILFKN